MAADIEVFRLEHYFREPSLWANAAAYHRLLWLGDGRGMLYVRSGLDFHIPQYTTTGWMIRLKELYLRNFLISHPAYAYAALFDSGVCQAFIQTGTELINELDGLAGRLEDDLSRGRTEVYLQPYVNLLLLHAANHYTLKHSLPRKSWEAGIWKNLQELMQQHYKTRLATDYYAARLKVNERKLNQICKAFSGKNILGKLNDMRFAEAQRRLLLTSDPVKVIGLELGYDNPSQFSNFFRQLKGMSPVEFRKMRCRKTQGF
ncbi:MAG: helix-turn-helix domain-containing protein [Bacteroidota bacterium]